MTDTAQLERGEVSRATRRSVEQMRDEYLRVLEEAAKEAQIVNITGIHFDVDKLIQFGENIACEGRLVDSNLL